MEILVVWSKKWEYTAFVVEKAEESMVFILFYVYLKIENNGN